MTLRGRNGRTRKHNGRLKKHPTQIITWNYHTHVWTNSGAIVRLWKTERFFL